MYAMLALKRTSSNLSNDLKKSKQLSTGKRSSISLSASGSKLCLLCKIFLVKKKKSSKKQTSKQFMRSKQWQELRQQALDRDQHECYLCGSKESLCVHHLRYRKFDKALQDKVWNLVTLCVKCHFRVHKSSANLDLAAKLSEERPEQWEHVISRK